LILKNLLSSAKFNRFGSQFHFSLPNSVYNWQGYSTTFSYTLLYGYNLFAYKASFSWSCGQRAGIELLIGVS